MSKLSSLILFMMVLLEWAYWLGFTVGQIARRHPRSTSFVVLAVVAIASYSQATFGGPAFWVAIAACVGMGYIVIVAVIAPKNNTVYEKIAAEEASAG